MKLKYYLRGLGIGIIATTLILMIAFSQYKTDISDAEVIKRAEALGMVMKEDSLFGNHVTEKDTLINTDVSTETEQSTETEMPTETEVVTETEAPTEIPTEIPTETETPVESETETVVNSENVGTTEMYHLVISAGDVPRLICEELEENGVIEDAASLRQYLTDVGFVKYITIGEYDIPYGASNDEVYQILKAGSPLYR